MRDENCIFCKIIAGEIPSNTIYEDDEFKVVLDVSPASKGTCADSAKESLCRSVWDRRKCSCEDAMKLAKKLAIHMTDVLKCERIQSGSRTIRKWQDRRVFHFHAPDPKIPQCKGTMIS